MAETSIEWCRTDLPDGTFVKGYTFNPWLGCAEVSQACDSCYARTFVTNRMGKPQLWQGERQRTSASNWRLPLKWNKIAERIGIRRKVFCASLSDVFDNQVPADWRADLWALIAETPHLDWLLLTKRPQNIGKMLPGSYVDQLVGRDLPPWPWSHVWLGTTVENQEEGDRRLPHLLNIPAARLFVSAEPLLGPIDFTNIRIGVGAEGRTNVLAGWWGGAVKGRPTKIDMVIVGGESGPKRRPMDLAWARAIRDQCAEFGTAFFGKQLDKVGRLPDDLMVRQFPEDAGG